jgi:hypothetical protein
MLRYACTAYLDNLINTTLFVEEINYFNSGRKKERQMAMYALNGYVQPFTLYKGPKVKELLYPVVPDFRNSIAF